MEQQNQPESPLFGLNIDMIGKAHLAEAARWARFLAICGFIFLGLAALAILFGGTAALFSSGYSRYDSDASSLVTVVTVVYIIFIILGFFPYLFLYRFATKLKVALATDDQETLNGSFQNLKIMFRYVGIFTIIILSLWILSFLIGLAAGGGRTF